MQKKNLGKIAGRVGMAALLLAVSGTIMPAGSSDVPGVVLAASGTTFTVDYADYTFTLNGKASILTGYKGSVSTVDLSEVIEEVNRQRKDADPDADEIQITQIGEGVFRSNTNLTKVVLPDTLEVIGKSAFDRCTNLKEVAINEETSKLTTIGENAFTVCTSLTAFSLPNNLKTIGDNAFSSTNISSITIPASCTSIEGGSSSIDGAFLNCKSLTTVTFAEREQSIELGQHVFSNCTQLQQVINFPKNVNLTNGKSSIPNGLFSGCSALTRLTLPENCISIGNSAFSQCAKLNESNFEIPDGCETIGDKTFYSCSGFSHVVFPDSVTTIGTYNFNVGSKSLLKTVDFGKGDPKIGANSFTNDTIIFYCEPGTEAETYAQNNRMIYQRHAEKLRIAQESAKKEYDYGDTLDWKTGITLEAVYTTDAVDENGEEKWTVLDETALANCVVTGYDKARVGTQKITIAYGGAEAEYNVVVYYNLEKDVQVTIGGRTSYTCTFTGSAIEPEISLTNTRQSNVIVPEDAYKVEYADNVSAGTAAITLTGTKDTSYYRGTLKKSFTINKASLRDAKADFGQKAFVYNGLEHKPVPTLTFNNYKLVEGVDYLKTMSYSNNIAASEESAYVQITASNSEGSNFTGTGDFHFEIQQKELTADMIADIADQEYTGSAITPEVSVSFLPAENEDKTVLTQKTADPYGTGDYTVKYKNNETVGAATVTVTATDNGNYKGSAEKTFQITPVPLMDGMITIADQEYTGDQIEVVPSISKGENLIFDETSYTIKEYEANTEAGEARVTIEGTNLLTGTVTKTFRILPADLAKAEVADIETLFADGTPKTPEVSLTLNGKEVPADSYTLSYEDNTNVGTATVKAEAKEDTNYTGTVSRQFQIRGFSLDSSGSGDESISFDISLDVDTIVYNGEKNIPGVTVKKITQITAKNNQTETQAADTDENTEDADQADTEEDDEEDQTDTVDHKESAEQTDADENADTADSTENADQTDVAETKEEILEEGVDYLVEAGDAAADVGTYTVTVKGTGLYEGSRELTYRIEAADISEAVMQTIGEQIWTGSEITPEVEIQFNGETLDEDTDFEVAYRNNTEPGTASVVVTGIGNYQGELAGSFTIRKEESVSPETPEPETPETQTPAAQIPETQTPAAQTPETQTPVTQTLTTEAPAQESKVKAPKKVTIKSLKNKASKKMVVSWKKLSGVSGYEVTIATKKNFKQNKQTKNTSKVSYTFTKLKKGKTYYVRVRAYKISNGKKTYGTYSTVKKLKITK